MNDAWFVLGGAGLGTLGAVIGGFMTARSTLKVARISQQSTLDVASLSEDREDRRVRREELKEIIIAFYDVALETYRQELQKVRRIKNGTKSAERDKRLNQARIDLIFARDRLLLFHSKLGSKASSLSDASMVGTLFKPEDGDEGYEKLADNFKKARSNFIKEAREVLEIEQ